MKYEQNNAGTEKNRRMGKVTEGQKQNTEQ